MRPYHLILVLAALLAASPAAADMIWFEDPCDNHNDWGGFYGTSWAASAAYSHGESSYGIGHPVAVEGSSAISRWIQFPDDDGPSAQYLTFWYYFANNESDIFSSLDFRIDGVWLSSYADWQPTTHKNQWVYVNYPASGFQGREILFEMVFAPQNVTWIPDPGASVAIDTIMILAGDVEPDFTGTPASGSTPLTVSFADTTDWSSLKAWYWDFGDGSTSTSASPSHTYNYAGLYDVSLTVATSWDTISSPQQGTTTKSAFVTVGDVVPTPIPTGNYSVDFTGTPTSGSSPLIVNFTGSVSPATNVSVWHWSFGDGAETYGQNASHTYNAYMTTSYDVTLSTEDETGAVAYLTKPAYITINGSSTSAASGGANTVPVRFILQDYVGKRFSGVTVTATPLESSGPWSWILDLLGIPSEIDIENEVLTGTTGSDGAIVFAMVKTVKYRIDFVDESQGIDSTITIYPSEDAVPVYIWPATTPAMGETVTYDLTATAIDDDNTRLRLAYRDAAKNTTSVTFRVTDENGTLVHSETSTGESNVTLTYDMANDPGAAYIFGFTAVHGIYGDIAQDQFVRFENNRPRVDFADWIPIWAYNWTAVAMMVCIAAIFGFKTLKFGVVLVPTFALVFSYMGWLETPLALVIVALVIGILLYMRISEGEGGL